MILRSRKLFDEVELKLWNYDEFNMHRLAQVFQKFRASLRKITIKFSAINENLLMRLLNMLPELEDITVDISLINPSANSSEKLKQLKNVKNLTCKVEAAKIIFELPNECLKKLSFGSVFKDTIPSQELLEKICEKQKNIEEFNFDPEKFSSSLKFLNLKKLRLASCKNCEAILVNQPNLTHLEMHESVSNRELETICDLNELKSLTVEVETTNTLALAKHNCLMKLEELKITLNQVCQLRALKEKKLPCLQKLELNLMFEENFNLIFENFFQSFPRIKHLKLSHVDEKTLKALISNISLESLDINKCLIGNKKVELPAALNENLKELKICHGFSSFLHEILKALLNLEKLILCEDLINDTITLKLILTSCKKLTHFALVNQKCASFPFNKIIILLKENGRNLRHFEYHHVKFMSDVGKFKSSFDAQFQFIYGENENKTLIMRNEKWLF